MVHNTIHNSQDMEATQAPIDSWKYKEDMMCVCVYTQCNIIKP